MGAVRWQAMRVVAVGAALGAAGLAVPAGAGAHSRGAGATGGAGAQAVARPVSIQSVSGDVHGAHSLIAGHGAATLVMSAGGPQPTIVLDYGHDVGGLPFFHVARSLGGSTLEATYSESLPYLLPGGDGAPSAQNSNGDPSRVDSYTVTGPGLIVNHLVQGGERFEQITLTTPGRVTLSSVGIVLTSSPTYRPTPVTGSFRSSDPALNTIWKLGANSVAIDSVAADSLPAVWGVSAAGTLVPSSGSDLYQGGGTWSDYTETFTGTIKANEMAWSVLGTTLGGQVTMTLDSHTDEIGTPDTLVVTQIGNAFAGGGTSQSFPVGFAVPVGTPLKVSTAISGTSLTVSVGGQPIATTTVTPTAGSVGFSNANGASAVIRNLDVTAASGQTLYRNPMTGQSVLRDFAAGTNPLPVMIDGAKRDRLVWGGDLSQSALTEYYTAGADQYVKGSLALLGSYPQSDGEVAGDLATGLAPGVVPASGLPEPGAGAFSLGYSEYWPINLYDYYMYTGDLAFVREEWPVLQNELAYLQANTDSDGLIDTNPGDGLDWAIDDQPGEVTEYNVLYDRVLTTAAVLAQALGHSGQAAGYTEQAQAVRTAINTNLLPAGGVYERSNAEPDVVVQDANSMAVLWGVAPAAQAGSILSQMETTLTADTDGNGPQAFSDGVPGGSFFTDPQVISPFMSAFEADAYFSIGDSTDALNLIRTVWGHMLPGQPFYSGDTFEAMGLNGEPGETNSLAHAWSSGATSALSEYVLGVAPTAAGFSQWAIAPQLGDLRFARGTVPTPYGPILTGWRVRGNGGGFSLREQAPAETAGSVAVPELGTSPTIREDGRVVWSHGQPAAGVSASESDGSVVFTSVSGSHTFRW